MLIDGYDTGNWYDELFDAFGKARPEAEALLSIIKSQPDGEFARLQETANAALVNLGITFNVYGEGQGVERVLQWREVPQASVGVSGTASTKRLRIGYDYSGRSSRATHSM